MNKKKILHLLSSNSFSGAENVACQIIKNLASFQSYELVYCSPDGIIRNYLSDNNIKFLPLKDLSISALKENIALYKPDVIHAHDMKASFYASLTCKDIPLISHIHNNSLESRKFNLKTFLYLFATKKCRHIFWVSKSALNSYYFSSSVRSKSTVLYNIIDTEYLSKLVKADKNEYNYDIVYLGRLSEPKNPKKLAEVFEKVLERDSSIKIAVVGAGDMYDEFISDLRKRKIFSHIALLGFQKNPYKILASAKLMIMTSTWEGLPMCVLEAAALKVPIVSTPTDGVAELFSNAKGAFLSNSTDDLVSECVNLVHNPTLREEFSNQIYKTFKNHNDNKLFIKVVEQIYRSS